MKRLCLVLLCIMLFVCSASAEETQIFTDFSVQAVALDVQNVEETEEVAAPETVQNYSITTGLPTDKEARIMAIQMDNEPGARPQKGIGSADIVYEVEIYAGGYTRYTGVFNDTIPEFVEAIRSTRMINIDISKEYGGVFIHYGVGVGVNEYLASGVRPEVRYDGLKGLAEFYRDSSRKAPNNVVCKFQELYNKTDWSATTANSPLQFSETAYTVKGENANEFTVHYRDGYRPSYKYSDGKYYRYYNENPHNDGTTGEQLSFSNVIVQHANQYWANNGETPVVEIYTRNRCDYFIDGLHFTGYSERKNPNENTVYYDADGNEVIFKPGKTFIQILKEGRELTIDGTEAPGTLKNGSRGEDVKKLQQKLVDMGLLSGKVDGIFGNMTEAAVEAAQKELGMEQTGVANPDFLKALYAQ